MESEELKFVRVTKEPHFIERLMRRYEKNPIIRGLVQFLPSYGAAFDTAITTELDRVAEERAKAFFDELATGALELKEEHMRSEPFLHCYFATQAAAFRTMRREKIRAFARLLKSAIAAPLLLQDGSYEEYLQILDDLSFREMTILNILEQCESANPFRQNENDLQNTERHWSQFVQMAREKTGLSEDELRGVLARLNRSGCYETLTGSGYGGSEGGRGRLTGLYHKLKSLVNRLGEEEEGDRGSSRAS